MQKCARCGEEFAPVRFIQDLKKTLHDVDENYFLHESPVMAESESALADTRSGKLSAADQTTHELWWQDICPTCKRVMRGQANMTALGRNGNQFL